MRKVWPHIILENRWATFRSWMVVHPIISIDILGITIFRVGAGKKYVFLEVLNLCIIVR